MPRRGRGRRGAGRDRVHSNQFRLAERGGSVNLEIAMPCPHPSFWTVRGPNWCQRRELGAKDRVRWTNLPQILNYSIELFHYSS